MTEPGVEGTVYIAASQGGGKTEIVLNVAGYHMDADPSPMLLVEPTVENADAISKDRIAPMLRATPCLREKVRDPRSRDSGNTIRHKEFPGGHLTLVGANSPSGLAMRPIRVVLFDEIDRYGLSAGSEGDPIKLGETRTFAYSVLGIARKLYVTSPGLMHGRSRKLWMRTDQQEFYVPCPDCGHEQVPDWSQVQWEKDEETGDHRPETAVYVCSQCGSCWDDLRRWSAIRKGGYQPTAEFRGWHGFRAPGLVILGSKLEAFVQQWLEAQGNPELLKVFINTVLADWWEEKYTSVGEDGIRREPFPEVSGQRVAPDGVAVMTAGVDLQDNRIEVSIEGWGRGEESWKLGYHVLDGDPSGPAVWQSLWELLCRPIPLERGGFDYIRASAVDTGGHHTQAAYAFVQPRTRVRTPDGKLAYVFAIKGTTGAGQVWPYKASRNNVAKVPLWNVRVDPAKEVIYGRLQKVVEPGPGYIHIPDTPEFGEAWAKQLTAEKVVERLDRKGFPVRVWEKKSAGARNEALDTAVYAYAALCGLRAMGLDLEAECDAIGTRPEFIPPDPGQGDPGSRQQPQRPDPARAPVRSGRTWVEPRADWMQR